MNVTAQIMVLAGLKINGSVHIEIILTDFLLDFSILGYLSMFETLRSVSNPTEDPRDYYGLYYGTFRKAGI